MAFNEILNIVEYLGAEHQNEMISFANIKEEHGALIALDELYREILNTFTAEYHEDLGLVISSLMMSVKNELYISMSQLLKTNVGKAFVSARIAIDAGFHAYYLTLHPQHVPDFFQEESPLHKQRFWRIKDHVKKNIKEYPLAKDLIGAHEFASNYFAHSCFKSLGMKLEILKREGPDKLLMNCFDKMDESFLLHMYFALLLTYYRLLKLFYECFFRKEFKVIYEERERKITELGKHLLAKYKQYGLGTSAG